ncbi:uncharacterized protein F5891DRAFT_1198886 [Suillus fuscotomentosus]|uniref:Uncharacterized protein n=1 Tax=Suillus fuscotomentosus TaxID=1912939 RepID=A0AAD4DPY5_9AGAM|nr:uncharacterized protein F5891DRAFT_1198886 [Suillus fuscotomentosus]KAG1889009.1 hypothetical protein F5891DRAFT_1198886 [Suillus fuscotomentosus]
MELNEEEDDVHFGDMYDSVWDEIRVEEEMAAEFTDYFPGTAKTYGMDYTFLSLFNTDENRVYCKTNMYYLFSCKQEWEIASWLLGSGLSMGKIDLFLSVEMVRLGTFLCHSAVPKSCEDEQKC